jgi:hypothetical protein
MQTDSAEQLSLADMLRNSATALDPDARALATVSMRADGATSMGTLDERHGDVSQFDLTQAVPLDIRVHFETAKNLYLYAWFVYRFYPVAEQQALATLEFGLRTRLAMLDPAKYGPNSTWIPSLSKMLKTARKEGLVSNAGMRATERWAMQRARNRVSDDATRRLIESGAECIEFDLDSAVPEPQDYSADALSIFIETRPAIRNALAHGSSMLHPTVLGTFEIVADLVNQLYPVDAPAIRPRV